MLLQSIYRRRVRASIVEVSLLSSRFDAYDLMNIIIACKISLSMSLQTCHLRLRLCLAAYHQEHLPNIPKTRRTNHPTPVQLQVASLGASVALSSCADLFSCIGADDVHVGCPFRLDLRPSPTRPLLIACLRLRPPLGVPGRLRSRNTRRCWKGEAHRTLLQLRLRRMRRFRVKIHLRRP